MEVRAKKIENNEPVAVIKVGNATSKMFLPDLSHLDNKEIERLIEESDQRIVDIWINAYGKGRYKSEMLKELGPLEMIKIF